MKAIMSTLLLDSSYKLKYQASFKNSPARKSSPILHCMHLPLKCLSHFPSVFIIPPFSQFLTFSDHTRTVQLSNLKLEIFPHKNKPLSFDHLLTQPLPVDGKCRSVTYRIDRPSRLPRLRSLLFRRGSGQARNENPRDQACNCLPLLVGR